MTTAVSEYLDHLVLQTKNKITTSISPRNTKRLVSTAIRFHIENDGSARFQDYYYQILGDRENFLSDQHFFRKFKHKYALQGIDGAFLDRLEKAKPRILQLIDQRQLAELYFNYFAAARIRQKSRNVRKDLGSFFTKLVHTFLPDEYTALDNPEREYFGLSKESFFVAFCVISRAYREWASENQQILVALKGETRRIDKNGRLQVSRMTDLKVLDLIFWYRANIENR